MKMQPSSLQLYCGFSVASLAFSELTLRYR